MKTLSDINAEIAIIKQELEAIDLTKITTEDKETIVQKAESPINNTKELMKQEQEESITGEQTIEYWDALIAVYAEAQKDIDLQLQVISSNKTKKLSAKQIRGMQAVKEKIQEMYEELTHKKQATEVEVKKFGAETLADEYALQREEAARSADEKIDVLQSYDDFENQVFSWREEPPDSGKYVRDGYNRGYEVWMNLEAEYSKLNAFKNDPETTTQESIIKIYEEAKKKEEELEARKKQLKDKRAELEEMGDTAITQDAMDAIDAQLANINTDITNLKMEEKEKEKLVAEVKLMQIKANIQAQEKKCEKAAEAVREDVRKDRKFYSDSIAKYVESAFYSSDKDKKPYEKLAILLRPRNLARGELKDEIDKDFRTIIKTEVRMAELDYVKNARGITLGTGTGTQGRNNSGTQNTGRRNQSQSYQQADLVKTLQLKMMSDDEKYDQAFEKLLENRGRIRAAINRFGNKFQWGKNLIKRCNPNMIEQWMETFVEKKPIVLTEPQKRKAVEVYETAMDKFRSIYHANIKGHRKAEIAKEDEPQTIVQTSATRNAKDAAVNTYDEGMEH